MPMEEGWGVVQNIAVAMETGAGTLGAKPTGLMVELITSTVLEGSTAKSV